MSRRTARRKSAAVRKPANRNKFWCCPFWRYDERQAINCEGGRITFPTPEAAEAYMGAYCAANPEWQACTVAAALYEYYDKIEEEKEHEKKRRDQRAQKSK